MSHPLLTQLAEKVFSVAEYLELVNSILTPLTVDVVGEVTDLKVLPQWTFFSLKDADDGSLLRCGLHSGQYRRLGVLLEEGMQIKVSGYGKLAGKSGNFGFWVSKIEPIGEGALRRAYELLVKKLDDEGLFVRKRALPACISHIGVISSRNGVVIQDVRKNLKPLNIRIDFMHSGVEGADSAGEILRAIEFFSHTHERPQVLVLIRGGGSLESLQGFNNEAVCRAIFATPMPVLVGIGHDVDAPIATMVADWSASTPTAVAHVINGTWALLTERTPLLAQRISARFHVRIRTVGQGLPRSIQSICNRFSRRVQHTNHRIALSSQKTRFAVMRVVERFTRYEEMLRYAIRRFPLRIRDITRMVQVSTDATFEKVRKRIHTISNKVEAQDQLLIARDPVRVLARGYALVYGDGGTLVRSMQNVTNGDTLKTRLCNGVLTSTVTDIKNN